MHIVPDTFKKILRGLAINAKFNNYFIIFILMINNPLVNDNYKITLDQLLRAFLYKHQFADINY